MNVQNKFTIFDSIYGLIVVVGTEFHELFHRFSQNIVYHTELCVDYYIINGSRFFQNKIFI